MREEFGPRPAPSRAVSRVAKAAREGAVRLWCDVYPRSGSTGRRLSGTARQQRLETRRVGRGRTQAREYRSDGTKNGRDSATSPHDQLLG